MIIVVARDVFDTEENRDRAVIATQGPQGSTRLEEPGCQMYCFAPDPVVPTEIQVYELWDTASDLDAHFKHQNYTDMVDALGNTGGMLHAITRQYVADDRGTVYDEGTPRIDALDRNSLIIVVARLVFETQEHRDLAVIAGTEPQAKTREEEPGCLMYCFAPDPVVPTEIQVYELWENAASLDAHFKHPNYMGMVQALGSAGGVLDSINRQYVVNDRGTVYDDDQKPRIEALLAD